MVGGEEVKGRLWHRLQAIVVEYDIIVVIMAAVVNRVACHTAHHATSSNTPLTLLSLSLPYP